jgi:hypothetical protein
LKVTEKALFPWAIRWRVKVSPLGENVISLYRYGPLSKDLYSLIIKLTVSSRVWAGADAWNRIRRARIVKSCFIP